MDKDSSIKIQIDKAAPILAAVSNGKRMGIIKMLLSGEHNVGDLAIKVGLSQSATSQHLRLLKLAGVLLQRKDAQTRYCSINPDMTSVVERLIWIAEEGGSSVDPKKAHRRP